MQAMHFVVQGETEISQGPLQGPKVGESTLECVDREIVHYVGKVIKLKACVECIGIGSKNKNKDDRKADHMPF
jgi:hypothetical protein